MHVLSCLPLLIAVGYFLPCIVVTLLPPVSQELCSRTRLHIFGWAPSPTYWGYIHAATQRVGGSTQMGLQGCACILAALQVPGFYKKARGYSFAACFYEWGDQHHLRLQAALLTRPLPRLQGFISCYPREIKLLVSLPSRPGDQEAHGFGLFTGVRFSSMAIFICYFSVILFETHLTHVAYITTLLGAEVESSDLNSQWPLA